MIRYLILSILVVTLGLASCQKDAASGAAPVISALNVYPNIVRSGSSEDTVFLVFQVEDANGDLGNDPYKKQFDIFVKDSRDNNEVGFPFPEIPADLKNPVKGINAFATVKMNAALFLQLRQDKPDGDTLYYDMYVKDKAGNKSNVLTTPLIYITP